VVPFLVVPEVSPIMTSRPQLANAPSLLHPQLKPPPLRVLQELTNPSPLHLIVVSI